MNSTGSLPEIQVSVIPAQAGIQKLLIESSFPRSAWEQDKWFKTVFLSVFSVSSVAELAFLG